MKSFRLFLLLSLFLSVSTASAVQRSKYNFNSDWLLSVGDHDGAEQVEHDDSRWQRVTLPRAFNEDEAFKVPINRLSDTIMWYRKHFKLNEVKERKFFIEFEGVRFGADFYLNGHHLGISENGVMACGFDLTPYVKEGDNVMAVRVDNSWNYRERATGTQFQWNNKNFNANYGGIPKNVWLYETDLLYQTLPLYSNLQTTGVYIYGSDYDIAGRKVKVNAESQIHNADVRPRTFTYLTRIIDLDGKEVARFEGERKVLQPGETTVARASGLLEDAHFWSWGYGYLYWVKTILQAEDGSVIDEAVTRTGFRKTRFAEGKIWLNDRVLMVHGYAQRTSNEWPGVGMSVPAWMSDYSNRLQVESGGNVVRWMHVTPWKQDVESCDRVGLIQAMPAGDAEKDCKGRQWEQRCELMRDAIIYNRNNPSILFYEGGNESISREHMLELKRIRDQYDPNGGRAIGSREMLDIDEAEYGGEMLYVNKSGKHPLWQMEYNRDEGLRKYWDEQSYPYHKEGAGPLYRGAPAPAYNHNMDMFARGMVERWYEYFVDRPGTGRRVNSGGVKIVFSDTNTHYRGESNYRTSGVTDALRIPKDAFYVHQVMWDGWVTPEKDRTYIIGHWNYAPGTKKTVSVVSSGDDVELFLNGRSLGHGKQQWRYLYNFEGINWEAGKLEAVSYRNGLEVSRYAVETAGDPDHLKVTAIENPEGFKADGADMAIIQFEVVDKLGRRCPLDNRNVHFNLWGEGEWRGGIATPRKLRHFDLTPGKGGTGRAGLLDGPASESTFDNYILSQVLPVECGVNRALVRSTVNAGDIEIMAAADGLKPVKLTLRTKAVINECGLGDHSPAMTLMPNLSRGATPLTPSYRDNKRQIEIASAVTAKGQPDPRQSYDDNELSEWKSDGKKANAWITYRLKQKTKVDEIAIKLTGWRNKVYPLAIYEGGKKVWEGLTYATLGYVHISIPKAVKNNELTIKMLGPSQDSTRFDEGKELAGGQAGELDRFKATGKTELRIVEIDLLQQLK